MFISFQAYGAENDKVLGIPGEVRLYAFIR